MKKVRQYTNERIETCRNCRGAGKVAQRLPAFEPVERIGKFERCPVCKGSGWVKKTANIEVTIEPSRKPKYAKR